MNEENSSIMVPVSLSDEEQEINSDDKIEPVEAILVENMESKADENHVTNGKKSSIMVPVSLSDEEQEINSDDKIEPVEAILVENMESQADENHVTNGDPNDKTEDTDFGLALRVPLPNFEKRIEVLEQDRGQLTAEVISKDILITNLEKETSSLKSEVTQLETNHANIVDEHERKFLLLSEEMSAKVTELKKQYVNANKEKESMVMKYALNEREIIIQKKHREESEKKMKNALKERDDAVNKSKNAIAEKLKLQQLADSRLQDTTVLKKEIERWKEEVKVQEGKSALNSGRLKSEVDAHKETREKLDKLLTETRAENEKIRSEYSEFIKKLKEEEKRQKFAEQEQSVKIMIDEAAKTELVILKVKHSEIIEKNETLSNKAQDLETDKNEFETTLTKLKDTVEVQKREIVDLMAQVAKLESLKMRLSSEEEKYSASNAEVDRLKADNTEINNDMVACRKKEAELLEFTQKLTETNVTLQSECAFTEGRASALESEHTRLTNKVSELEAVNSQLKIELESETKNRKSETEVLAKKLADTVKQLESAKQKAIDAINEVSVLKRKNQSSLRELTKELKDCQRKLDNHQSSLRLSPVLSHSSRASSNSSLNRLAPNGDSHDQSTSPTVSCGSNLSLPTSDNLPNGYHHPGNLGPAQNPLVKTNPQLQVSSLPSNVPDSQVLVEKIVKLQKEMAKRQEKLDFMEEHVDTMVYEMKKKNKLLQGLMLKQDAGALASTDMDQNKHAMMRTKLDERRTSEHSGIMSSLYSSKANDTGMTMELSLEINQKLQAVLEDTLLKNITLKENINTLGREIAILSVHQQEKQ